jgi:2-keto-3-deoxy-L-rhamnonate aldolase RhmA
MDLSVSQGTPGRYDTPEFAAAMARVIAACKANGKHGACLVTSVEAGKRWLDLGFRVVIFANDIILLTSALRAGLEGLRGE